MENRTTFQGQIAYLEDALEVVLTGAVTASSIVSVDGRFTVTLAGITSSASAYQIQVSNANPAIKTSSLAVTGTGQFTSGGNANRFPTPESIDYTLNPKLEASWVTLTAFNVAGYVIVDGCFRLMRILKTTGFDAGAKAYVFAEKMSPVIQ